MKMTITYPDGGTLTSNEPSVSLAGFVKRSDPFQEERRNRVLESFHPLVSWGCEEFNRSKMGASNKPG